MKPRPAPVLDPRRGPELVAELLARGPGYLPAWRPRPGSPGDGLTRVWARYFETLLERLGQAPEKNRLAFFDLAGVDRVPATAARAPVVFRLAEGAAAQTVAAGSRLAAPPQPGGDRQIVYETERAAGLTPGRLVQVVSLVPGRDEWADHSAAIEAEEPFVAFEPRSLGPTPHHLYLAHPTLLALAGKVELQVVLDLSEGGSEPLDLAWEYWDGELWRALARPGCGGGGGGAGSITGDGTGGLTASGTVVLANDCAESVSTEVVGHESHWLRARLDEPLPPDPDQLLPQAREIRLTAVHRRELRHRIAAFTAEAVEADSAQVTLHLQDAASGPLSGVRVELFVADTGQVLIDFTTDGDATFLLLDDSPGSLVLRVELAGGTVRQQVHYAPPSASLSGLACELIVEVDALLPQKAFANADALDLTKPFYPLGQAPRPGSAFYFAAPEPLAKPGARLTVHLERAATPEEELAVEAGDGGGGGGGAEPAAHPLLPGIDFAIFRGGGGDGSQQLEHSVAWEYHDGERWRPLAVREADVAGDGRPGDLSGSGRVEITVPDDAASHEVHGAEDLWLRVRLLEGSYGLRQTVKWSDGNGGTNSFTYVLPQPPALKSLRLSYVWENGPHHAEKVFTYDDFRHVDRTEAARWPSDPFPLFAHLADPTPALYLGFDAPFPSDRVGLFLDLEEERGADRPALLWETFGPAGWRRLAVEDATRDLAGPGTVSFVAPADSRPLDRFDAGERHWLRARRGADGPAPAVGVGAIHPNAVWVAQRETQSEETLGTHGGRPHEVFRLRRVPVLDGERVEVRELTGARARVEWRRLALEVVGGGEARLRDLERRLGAEDRGGDVVEGDLRLRRDAEKQVVEAWVRWHAERRLVLCDGGARCFELDRVDGRVAFGEGDHGRVPPPGSLVVARSYVSGGGRDGNVAAGAIQQALTGVAGVEAVFNPVPAEGGADSETLEAYSRRAPRSLAHRGRGLAAGDLETLAREASPAVAVARALPARDAAGRQRPGWVTLVVLPSGDEARPWPSAGLRERVRAYVAARMEAGVASAHRLHVTGPRYVAVGLEARLRVAAGAAAGDTEAAARAALERFLHPLAGGAMGEGWEPGRAVYRSDVAALLEDVPGVDAVTHLDLRVDGVPRGESVAVAADATAAAGKIDLILEAGS